jgi:bifunctional non-homologous end joining protein LigD
VAKALKKGELKFVLDGERLHGSFVLVRMKGPQRQGREEADNWLLIKHHDDAGRPGEGTAVLEETPRSPRAGPWPTSPRARARGPRRSS